MAVYAVRVFKQGLPVGDEMYAEGEDANQAMDEVEARLGLEPPKISVDKSTGKLTVIGWHGFEFRAKKLH